MDGLLLAGQTVLQVTGPVEKTTPHRLQLREVKFAVAVRIGKLPAMIQAIPRRRLGAEQAADGDKLVEDLRLLRGGSVLSGCCAACQKKQEGQQCPSGQATGLGGAHGREFRQFARTFT